MRNPDTTIDTIPGQDPHELEKQSALHKELVDAQYTFWCETLAEEKFSRNSVFVAPALIGRVEALAFDNEKGLVRILLDGRFMIGTHNGVEEYTFSDESLIYTIPMREITARSFASHDIINDFVSPNYMIEKTEYQDFEAIHFVMEKQDMYIIAEGSDVFTRNFSGERYEKHNDNEPPQSA